MRRRALWIVSLVAAAALTVTVVGMRGRGPAGEESCRPRIEFRGAARSVGGSCLVVSAGGTRFAVDCGSMGENGGREALPVPDSLSFVILTHAHTDHCGRLPELYGSGFSGPIYCTRGTAKLAPVMLGMLRSVSREKTAREVFERAVSGFVAVPFGETVECEGVRFRFRRAEHLLGAASVEIWLPAGRDTVKLVVSGDIGGGNSVLVPPLDAPDGADYVVMESTYGGRTREAEQPDLSSDREAFARSVARALEAGGDVLIPAFALGRTQEVMAVIDEYQRAGVIPAASEVYVDSPTAHRITAIHRELAEELSARARELYPGEPLRFPSLREVRSKTSMKVHERRHTPAVFISSSGDLEHANSPRHLIRMFGKRQNLLCIIGWQQPGSVGARLLAGESPVLVRHQEGSAIEQDWIDPLLAVSAFHSFSGHADAAGLVRWLAGIRGARRVFLVHGEEREAESLAESIRRELGLEVEIPERGSVRELAPAAGS